MNYVLLILTLILAVNCAKPDYNAEAAAIVKGFEARYHVVVKNEIDFVESMEDDIVGLAYPDGHIELSKQYWDTLNELGKECVLYHELGHALFHLGHNMKLRVWKGQLVNASIMAPVTFGMTGFYQDLREYYKDELGKEAGL